MVLGTASGVGKSFVTAGLCRLLSNLGFRVAPFKAQNMSNNSYVTEEGGEMGRAQAVQAECARVKPHVDMNPVLLKPASDNGSQVILQGKSVGHFKAKEFYAQRKRIVAAIEDSYERLAASYEIIVLEGAGSPAEINLKQNDLVNMRMAELADARCLLVGDIDRGGVFASLIGTLNLLEAEEQERIAGFLINKFRGDASLLTEGLTFLEKRTGKKVWGVLPYERDLWIEEEDAVVVENQTGRQQDKDQLDIAVILLPRLSNFTDFEILKQDPSVRLRYVKKPEEMGEPDLLILPGTKATIADLVSLKEKGFHTKILDFVHRGGRVLGICGGYQMMGTSIRDSHGFEEKDRREIEGLKLFKMTTEFYPEKMLRKVEDVADLEIFGRPVSGRLECYEIHMGRSVFEEPYRPFGNCGVVDSSGKLLGTYYHGLFESSGFRESFLNALAQSVGKKRRIDSRSLQSASQLKESHYEHLGQLLIQHLNLDWLAEALGISEFHKVP